jgi:hypothetical protein
MPKEPSRGSDHENQSHDFKVKWRSDFWGAAAMRALGQTSN